MERAQTTYDVDVDADGKKHTSANPNYIEYDYIHFFVILEPIERNMIYLHQLKIMSI